MPKENGKVKNFNVKKFIIAMLIAAIVCVSVLSVLFGIDKTFSSGESITVSLIEVRNIQQPAEGFVFRTITFGL